MKTLLAAVLLCTPIMAQASDGGAPVAPAENEKKVCRSEESTGSMFVKRICHTKAEWAAIASDRQRSAQQMQNQSQGRGNGVDLPR